MNTTEILLWILAALKPMLPGLIAATVATVAMLIFLLIKCRNTWVQDKNFPLSGFFFGINGVGFLRLSCSWIKFIFLIVFVVGFRKLEAVNYLMLIFPGILLAVTDRGIKKKLGGIFWLVLEIAGLVAANIICGFILDVSASVGFIVVYVAMGLFMILFSIYLFLNEVSGISLQRTVEPREIWG